MDNPKQPSSRQPLRDDLKQREVNKDLDRNQSRNIDRDLDDTVIERGRQGRTDLPGETPQGSDR
jgi:hypothetical protein